MTEGWILIRSLLSESWAFFSTHVLIMSLIILPIVIPVEIFAHVYGYSLMGANSSFTERLLPTLVELLTYPVYSAATIFYIASVIEAKPIDVNKAWELGIEYWFPCFVLSVLLVVILVCGFALLIIPGVVLGLRYSFSQIDLLLNEQKPVESLKNSWLLTKGYMWVLFLGLSSILLMFYIPYAIFASLFDQTSIAYWIYNFVANLVSAMMGAFATIYVFRVYVIVLEQHNKSLNTDASDAGAG